MRVSRALPLLMVTALVLGCGRRDNDCSTAEVHSVVEPALLSFLSRARAAHHLADHQEPERPDLALDTLRSVLNGPRPGAKDRLAPEVREVLADTAARVADLESRLNQFENATRTLQEALPLVPDVSYFRGHLFEIQGLVEERRAEALAQRSDTAGARAARDRAMAAFEESMKLNAEVIRTASVDAGR